MPSKNTKQKDTSKPQPRRQDKPKAQKAAQSAQPQAAKENEEGASKATIAIAVIGVIIIMAGAFYLGNTLTTVPFSTFKSNFQGAANVSVIYSGQNYTQIDAEGPCGNQIIYHITSSGKKLSSINFFEIDLQNATCTYQNGPLGHAVIATANASYCINAATKYPTVFLNYSSSNYTNIHTSKMFVYGNSNYYALGSSCPIAVEFS